MTGHLPFLDLFLPLLRSRGGGLPGGALVALMPWEINDQATFSQHFPQWTVTLWPGWGLACVTRFVISLKQLSFSRGISPGDFWKSLEMFLVITVEQQEGCYWCLVDGDQRYC